MELNKKLSERRAAMIKQYLVENFHISAGNAHSDDDDHPFRRMATTCSDR